MAEHRTAPMTLEPDFLESLRQAHANRRIAEGVALLDESRDALLGLAPDDPCAPELTLLIAQWLDVGYRDAELLNLLLQRFTPELRQRMPVQQYLSIRMAEAYQAFSTDDMDAAIKILRFILMSEQECADPGLIVLAHFWKARAHRKKGEYDLALDDIAAARRMAASLPGGQIFAAVIQIQESWILFQRSNRKAALRLLDEAEAVLSSTDYFVALGNIESARGRIVRRAGEYARSLEHFERAIAIYSSGDPTHANLGRTLVNAAYVKRLLAQQLRKQIEAHRPNGDGGSYAASKSERRSNQRSRYFELCRQAMDQLQHAREIYHSRGHTSGIGSVILNTGYLHVDRGDIDSAAREAEEAHKLGLEKNDHILMARARILQASVENARVDEQLDDEEDIAIHAETAKRYCEEALVLAHHTQNRRLLASASVASGMTAANDFFQHWELAKQRAREARELLDPDEADSLLHELAVLNARIVQASGVNDALRSWSEGMVGDKTFQQITEEFAELVIPKVWLREGRTVSRVAQRLCISPKKVRRILRNTGHLGNG
jgi:tetratricopeptide (TPR) repeat protein